ncbi:MAG: hypothetical protein D6743_14685 [Calditrichaeota bacterium]|nr:MAG: hypothetical protein D6743_14685 [Calditrichota bacterium]
MRRLSIYFFIPLLLFLFSCRKEKTYKLHRGTPAYQLAKELASTLPSMDPDENRVLVSTKKFKITSGQVIQTIRLNLGNSAENLKTLKQDLLHNYVAQTVEDMAVRFLVLDAARQAGISLTQAEKDSALQDAYSKSGGEEGFIEALHNRGVDVETIKQNVIDAALMQRYFDVTLKDELQVTDADLDSAYRDTNTVTLRHIFMKGMNKTDEEIKEIQKKMARILKKAKNGADFAKLAEKYSEDVSSNKKGGLYKNMLKGKMMKELDEAAFSLPIGQISDVIKTDAGYHIIKVLERTTDKREPKIVKLAIADAKRGKVVKRQIEKLKREAGFKMHDF